MKKLSYLVLLLLLLFLGLTFTVQNPQGVLVKYYFGLEWQGALSHVLIVVFALGAAAGYLASLKTLLRLQRNLGRARKDVRQIEQEVVNLRALPIKDAL